MSDTCSVRTAQSHVHLAEFAAASGSSRLQHATKCGEGRICGADVNVVHLRIIL